MAALDAIPKDKMRELFSFSTDWFEFNTMVIRYDVICDEVPICVKFDTPLTEIKKQGIGFYRKKAETLLIDEIKKQGLNHFIFKDLSMPRGYITPECFNLLLIDA